MTIFKTQTRARYAETDASGVVYYNSYFVYFELGRMEMFRELQLPYDWHLPIAETHCRYRSSARFDDLLEIQSFVAELRSKGFRIAHRVLRLTEGEEPQLLVEGYTAMVTVGENHRPTPLPAAFEQAFRPILIAGDPEV